MRKLEKTLFIVVSTLLIFAPCYANAEEETEPTQSPNEPSITEPDPSTSPTPSESPIETPEVAISINRNTLSLKIGDSELLIATVTPENTTVAWTSSDESIAKVENGKVTAQSEGTATITAKAGEKEVTCTVTVEKEEVIVEKDPEYTLKSLIISNGNLNKTFNSNTLKYSVTIPSNVTALTIKASLTDSDKVAQYLISGNKNLKNGSIVQIIVSDKKTGDVKKVYELTIIKNTPATSLNLKSLKITGYALNETFNSNTLKYTANIPYEVEEITVQATAEDSDAKVSVSGVTNLKVGANTVTITVANGDGSTRKYQIIVTRETEVSVEENPTSIITSSTNQTSSISTVISRNSNSDNNFLKYAIVSIACLILFAIGGIGIYFYLKTSPSKLKKELRHLKKARTNSPIVEIPHESTNQSYESITNVMENEDLVQTKEFNKKRNRNNVKTEELFEELFNDSKDV